MIASGTDSSGADASGKSASAANVFGSLSFPDAVYGSPSGNKTGGIDTGDAVARESSHKALESFLRTGTFDEAALFIGSMLAKASIGETVKELLPFYAVGLIVLGLMTYVPALTLHI